MNTKSTTVRFASLVEADWYDYPQYYDMLFDDDTPYEADFIEAACLKYGIARESIEGVELLEPGCGSGRLAEELARRGCRFTGFDLSPSMLDYTKQRLENRNLRAELQQADMTDFELDRQFDAAYCLINTFRHLLTEEAAISHLESVARHVKSGGIYILGFHLIPPDADPECVELWSAEDDDAQVFGLLRVIEFDRAARRETLRVSVQAKPADGSRPIHVRSDFPLRLYMADQFRDLLAKTPQWHLGEVFDFNYEIDDPLPFNDILSDAVFILHRV